MISFTWILDFATAVLAVTSLFVISTIFALPCSLKCVNSSIYAHSFTICSNFILANSRTKSEKAVVIHSILSVSCKIRYNQISRGECDDFNAVKQYCKKLCRTDALAKRTNGIKINRENCDCRKKRCRQINDIKNDDR